MKVKVTFLYEPDNDAVDEKHEMGITDAEYDNLCGYLLGIGGEDVEVEADIR